MSEYKKKQDFSQTEEGQKTKEALLKMEENPNFNTGSTYSANSEQYPDNLITFTEKHMEYLRLHPRTNPSQYLANLRLITRLRDGS